MLSQPGMRESTTYSAASLQTRSTVIKGIMAVSNTGSRAASGIGIQPGYGREAVAELDLVKFSEARSGDLPKTGITAITLPLSARYIQTEDFVTPVRADGKLTFTIAYK